MCWWIMIMCVGVFLSQGIVQFILEIRKEMQTHAVLACRLGLPESIRP